MAFRTGEATEEDDVSWQADPELHATSLSRRPIRRNPSRPLKEILQRKGSEIK